MLSADDESATLTARLPQASRSAVGLLQILLAATLVLPILLFAAVAWLNYRAALVNAETELLRISEVAVEHAAKVFEGQDQVIDRVRDLIRGVDAEGIAQSERTFHDAFVGIVARVPEVQNVLVIDRDGHPLASAGVYPVPRDGDLHTRDYFQAIIGGYDGAFINTPRLGAISRQLFFGSARAWRDADGAVKGVINVAASPSLFVDFYAALAEEGADGGDGKIVTLLRSDGQVLVRYPPSAGSSAARSTAFLAAIHDHPNEGTYESRSAVEPESETRIFAYRKVQNHRLYVVAGRSRAAIVAGWRRGMMGHLAYGIPVTVALFAVTWTALVRTRREMEALGQAHEAIARRERAEAALLRAQRLEAVGQMTGGVAHDFNNLLTVILASAESLERRAEDPLRVRTIARQICIAAQKGGKITQQLLTFSRRQLVHPETVQLNTLLLEVRPLLESAVSEAVSMAFDLAPDLAPVRLDPGHFEAAVLNLVGNARDAMPNGGVIRVSTRPVRLLPGDMPDLPLGDYARVAVRDEGSGMSPQTAAKAFEPFFTTKEVGKGTGLGLSQVYGFAKQAGGDVRIQSAIGQGTTVEMLLPCSRETPVETTPAGPRPETASGEVVLVVEDEPGVRAAAVESLNELGYTALAASSAQAALARLRGSDRIDILFSDVVMPGGMSGVQLCVEARQLRPSLRMLLTSGYAADAVADGAADILLLTKPYDRDGLARSLRALLEAG